MNIFQMILNWVRTLFVLPMGHGVLPTASGGDEVFTPTVNMDGEWLPYLSKPYTYQYYAFGDAMDCVSQSGTNTVEAILNYFYKNNLFPIPEMKTLIEKYLNSQGYVELSVPYIAKLAGTTKQGLSMDAFWKAVNTYGMVPKKNWNKDDTKSWDEYYADIPDDVKNAGLDFAKIFQWNWQVFANNQWTTPDINSLKEVLTHSPVHFAGPVCPRTNGVMTYCGAKVYQHARCLYGISNVQEVLDQYSPFVTMNELNYPIGCGIKVAIHII